MDDSGLTRRDVLKTSFLGAAALGLPWQVTLAAKGKSRISRKRLPRPYTVPFTTPPVLAPVRTDATTDYYRLTQKAFVGEILPGVKTPLWGYDGLVPGPTILARRGRRTVVRQVNALPSRHPTLGYVPWTSTHLHGSPSEPQYDGYASDITLPGQYKDYVYPNDCSARTIWYHDHGMHHTAENVYMGLAAMYQISDPATSALPLPRGAYDVPVIISDVLFAKDGSLLWDDDDHSGVYGDVILVNGRPWPNLRVEQRKYRLRILNASGARGYRLRLSNGQPFSVIATDAGLMDRPREVTELLVGMAERYEIVVDFSALRAGHRIQLVNLGVQNVPNEDHTGKVMQFEVTGPATDTRYNAVPAVLGPAHPIMSIPVSAAKKSRYLRLKKSDRTNIWSINDVTWRDVVDSGYTRVFANPQPGDVEIWEVENKSGGWFHPTHIHFVDFRVLSRNGRPPRPAEEGPKDVVYVGENEKVKLLIHFSQPGGRHGRYMIHCHNNSHEDHDMMIQYQIGDHEPDCDPLNTAPPRYAPETPL